MIQIDKLADIVNNYDCFVFDCDGVLYAEAKEIGQAFSVLQWLMEQGKKVFFLTNSAVYTRN